MDAVIATEQLTKRYDDVIAVERLNLSVRAGEVFGLLGPNGAGKTTTILMLLGLSEPDEGRATVAGLDPTHDAIAVKQRVGYVPDSVGFYEQLSGRENLRFTARLNRLPEQTTTERIDTALTEVGLNDRADDRVGAYSRGMRQRLGIADALIKDPEILILDEPTVAIDPAGVDEMLALIRRLPVERGVTVLLSSHLLEQVQTVCDRIGIFAQGRLVACGTIDDLSERNGEFLIEVAATGRSIHEVASSLDGVIEVVDTSTGVTVVRASRDVREPLARAIAATGGAVTHLRLRSDDLADIYRRHFSAPDR